MLKGVVLCISLVGLLLSVIKFHHYRIDLSLGRRQFSVGEMWRQRPRGRLNVPVSSHCRLEESATMWRSWVMPFSHLRRWSLLSRPIIQVKFLLFFHLILIK